jgi:hypothetical protein
MAYDKNDTFNTFEWLKIGVERNEEKNNSLSHELMFRLIDSAIEQKQIEFAQSYMNLFGNKIGLEARNELREKIKTLRNETKNNEEINEWYNSLCRGDTVRSLFTY